MLQPEPTLVPGGQLGRERLLAEVLARAGTRRGVLCVAARYQRKEPIDAAGIEPAEQLGDLAADPGEVLDEPLEVLDQAVLVGAERLGVQLVQVDRPLQRPHERLRVLGQVDAAPHEIAQQQSARCHIRLCFPRQLLESAQPGGDVLERDCL